MAALPGGLPVAGGTDVMVELNFGTAAYRVQALRVVGARVLGWVWADYLKAGPG